MTRDQEIDVRLLAIFAGLWMVSFAAFGPSVFTAMCTGAIFGVSIRRLLQ
jgi:hypothetical protein